MTTVRQILSAKGDGVVTGDRTMSLGQAVARLADNRIGALIFVDEESRVVGILSERDVVRSLAKHGAPVLDHPASEHMTRQVKTCTREDTVEDLMDMMTAGRFRHLPVVEEGRLVGMVSIGDVVKHRVADIEHQAKEIRNYLFTS